jgi:hypothetical protein
MIGMSEMSAFVKRQAPLGSEYDPPFVVNSPTNDKSGDFAKVCSQVRIWPMR